LQLRRGEAGHRQVAGDARELGHVAHQRLALRTAAAIVPQDRRAQQGVVLVEQHRAVHLARQADAAHRAHRVRARLTEQRHRLIERRPPIGRSLLRPQRVRARDRERHARTRLDALRLGQQHELQFGGAEINAEVHGFSRETNSFTAE
jgi:hypothetical protein